MTPEQEDAEAFALIASRANTGRAMRPTENLRFLERTVPLGNGLAGKVRVLQQAWAPVHGGPCEWRDVPLVVEP